MIQAGDIIYRTGDNHALEVASTWGNGVQTFGFHTYPYSRDGVEIPKQSFNLNEEGQKWSKAPVESTV